MSDGTTVTADATLGSSNEGTLTTLSEAAIAKMVTDAKTSVLADVGRLQAEAEKALKAATAAKDRLAKLEQARIEAELEANRDNEPELRRIRAEQKTQKAETELAEREQELAEHKEKLTQLEAEQKQRALAQKAGEIAAKTGVDPEKLIKYAKATDGSPEAIEEIAKDLPKINPPKTPSKVDSNRSFGGSVSEEQIRKAYRDNPNDPQARADYLNWRRGRGI